MNLVVFDIDGTLLNNHAVEDSCFKQALGETLGLAALDTDWATYRDVSDDGVAAEAYQRAYGAALPLNLRDATVAHFVALVGVACAEGGLTLVAGADRIFADLEAAGWTVALATGAWANAAHLKLRAAGLAIDNRALATSEDGPARVAIVRAAMRRAAEAADVSSFARVVTVGDGVWDVEAARCLSLPFVGIGVGDRAATLRSAGATTILPDFSDPIGVHAALTKAVPPLLPVL